MSKYQLTDQLAVGGTATYGGEVYGGHLAANASNNHTVDWWRFDAFAEFEVTKNIEIEVTGLNLTDELYYDAIYQAGVPDADQRRGPRHLCLRRAGPRRVLNREVEIRLRSLSVSARSAKPTGAPVPVDFYLKRRACRSKSPRY